MSKLSMEKKDGQVRIKVETTKNDLPFTYKAPSTIPLSGQTSEAFEAIVNKIDEMGEEASALETRVENIEKVIPTDTTEENKLVNEQSVYKELRRVPNGEKPLRMPKVGDILWVDPANGDKYFLDKSIYPVSKAETDGLESVGVVADVEYGDVLILHKDEGTDLTFANGWLFKVDGITLDGTTNTLNMQARTNDGTPIPAGTFTDSTSTTLTDFCDAFDEWLREHRTVESNELDILIQIDWHCELMKDVNGVDSCFIVIDTFILQNSLTPIASGSTATANLYMWDFASQTSNISTLLRNNDSSVYYAGWNKDRLIEYFSDPTHASISPTNDPDGAGLLNLTDFNGTSYPAVKEYYGDYETYMEAMMMKWPSDEGSQADIKDKDYGIGLRLGTHTHKNLAGETVYTFPASRYAYTRATEATRKSEGLGDGDWYLPDIVNGFIAFSKMNTAGTDAINDSLSAISTRRSLNAYRWLAVRFTYTSTWYFGANGYFSYLYFTSALRVPVVTLLTY